MWDLQFSRHCFWRFKSSGMWCVVRWVVPKVFQSIIVPSSPTLSSLLGFFWLLRNEGATLLQNIRIKVKRGKCTLVQALRLCTGRTAHRGSRGIALPFLNHGTRNEWGISFMPQPLFTPGKDPVPTVQDSRWAPGPVWTGGENLAHTGIRSPDRPARSQSLYGVRCPAHKIPGTMWQITQGYMPEDFNLLRNTHDFVLGRSWSVDLIKNDQTSTMMLSSIKIPNLTNCCQWTQIFKSSH